MIESGLHAGIPWQNEEMKPGFTNEAAWILDLRCWYNWKPSGKMPAYWRLTEQSLAATDTPTTPLLVSLWNEPDRKDQANTSPSDAARLSRLWVEQHGDYFVGPNILLQDDWRDWLGEYLSNGGPKPYAWGFHVYPWTPEQYNEMLSEFRKFIGIGDERPWIITEVASSGRTFFEQKHIMDRVRASVEIGEIHAAFWFSAHYGSYKPYWSPTDLLNPMGGLTALGEYFVSVKEKEDYSVYLPVVSTS